MYIQLTNDVWVKRATVKVAIASKMGRLMLSGLILQIGLIHSSNFLG